MKITDYRTYVVATPWRNLTYLILETDEGLRGVGEARILGKTYTVLEYLKDVRRHFIGHEVYDIEDLYRRFTLLDFGSPGEVVMTGLALVEMACWDILGKKANLPVYQLIGGKVHDRIPAYANGWYTCERTPEEFAKAARRVVERGYKGLKFDPFGSGNLELTRPEFHKSIALIEAVHSVTGNEAQMFIEMHGRFAPHQAVEIAKAIEKFQPGWIEEPCRPEDLPALRYVMEHTSIPVATGERLYHAQQFRELFTHRLAHIIQPDLNQCGGLLETKKICSTAETYSMMAAPHNVGGIITTVATLHMMVGLRNAKVLEHFNDFVDAEIKRCGAPYPEVVDGYFTLPMGPGWGVEIDENFLASCPVHTENGIICDPGLNMFVNPNWHRRAQPQETAPASDE
ncbi:MAG TPA: mandelate racemase/muconate lactonizing enzyme family protein [Chthonomonadaceae bacterium]|nr:mandelate racemase/muconate lactonizing enzyme family protein [Chthonomonadaceae bacterium]